MKNGLSLGMRYCPLSLIAPSLVGREPGVERVDPDHLAEDRREDLRVARHGDVAGAHVVGVAAVAERGVEQAVGAEGDRAPVVVELGPVEPEDLAIGGDVDLIEVLVARPATRR